MIQTLTADGRGWKKKQWAVVDNDVLEDASNQLRRLMFIRAPEAPFKLVRELISDQSCSKVTLLYKKSRYIP